MPEHTGDFLDSGVYGETAAADESENAAAGASSEFAPYGVPSNGTGTGWRAALRPTAWLVAGVVAGAVAVAAWHSSQTSSAATANPAAAQGQFPNGQSPNGPVPNGQAPNGQVPNGVPGFGGPGLGGPGGGGRTGEQHVTGTVTAVTSSSVTVQLTNGGTATYAVIPSSDIVKNGVRVTLSAIKVDDTVFLHVYPSNGQTVVERLFAGDRPDTRGDPGTTTTTKT